MAGRYVTEGYAWRVEFCEMLHEVVRGNSVTIFADKGGKPRWLPFAIEKHYTLKQAMAVVRKHANGRPWRAINGVTRRTIMG